MARTALSNCSASVDVLRLLAAISRAPTEQHTHFATALGLPSPSDLQQWRIAHTATFVQQCPPHASFIVGNDGNIGGEAADRVADFRHMLGASIVPGQVDGLPDLLADYADLVAQATDDARAQHARATLLWEHLLSWITPYLDSVARSAPSPYDRWALLTRDVLYLEVDAVPAPQRLPLHLRAAPMAADLLSAETAEQAVRMMLTPIASGVVFTRADLARVPMQEQFGAVHYSRIVVIKYLLERAGPETLAWLAQETRIQAQARAAERPRLGCIATFWSGRAVASAEALSTMAAELGVRDLKRCD